MQQSSLRILLVGYSPLLRGGIPAVTAQILELMPNIELFAALKYYRPVHKQVIYTLTAYLRFISRLLILRPQVVHVLIGGRFDVIRNSYYILLARVLRIPVVVGFHSNSDSIIGGFSVLSRWLFIRILSQADELCFLSPSLRSEMLQAFDCKNKGVVIPNPIPSNFLEQSPLRREHRNGDLIFVGRWTKEKGAEELSLAMAELSVTDGLRCVCYGEIAPRGIEGCHYGGWLEGDAKLKVMREASLLLLPSHFEGYPNVLIEAAACGTPFVATQTGGVPDIYAASNGGVICEIGDAGGLMLAIRLLAADAGVWQQCSDSGRKWADSCSTQEIVNKWHELYCSLAS